MITWVPYTGKNLEEVVTKAELSKLSSVSLAGKLTPRKAIAAAATKAVDTVRSYVGKRYPLGPQGTIPKLAIKNAADAIARQTLIVRPPGVAADLLDRSRDREYDQAISWLKAVVADDVSIDDVVSGGGGMSVVSRRKKKFGGNPQLKGM